MIIHNRYPYMVTSFNILTPGNIRFGRGQARSAAPWLAQYNAPVLLVHGATPSRAEFLLHELKTLHLTVITLAIAQEPTLSDIERGVQLAREHGVGAVVSLGGGAAIDAGKAIAALVPATGPVIEYLEVVGTGRQLEAHPLPFVAIPTTSGTGAEVTKNAVINVPLQQRKVSLRDDRMLPLLAIVDPSLTDNAPRAVTLGSGLDALTQVIEPWLCTRATPFTDALCREAIPRGIAALKTLMEKECPDSRDELAWVSLCGGLALANAGLGVVHGLAGPLGGLSDASHGALCGCLLPFGLELNESQATHQALRQRFLEVRQWIAAGLGVSPDVAWQSLREWSQRAGLGNLRDLGVPREALEPAALAASGSSSMKANPVALDSEQLLEMLEAAWE
jgi:alcohol dehydrogenase class IV